MDHWVLGDCTSLAKLSPLCDGAKSITTETLQVRNDDRDTCTAAPSEIEETATQLATSSDSLVSIRVKMGAPSKRYALIHLIRSS